MTTPLRFFAIGIIFAISHSLSAQNCGCSQCDLPIVADYGRSFELDVSGASNNDLSSPLQGICAVEIDFAHDFLSDLFVTLTSPQGQTITLVSKGVTADTTYGSRWKVKFLPCGSAVVPDAGFAPDFDDNLNWPQHGAFEGSYYPASGCLENFDAGPVNGKWHLWVSSTGYRGVGFIYGFNITFCDPQGISCDGLNYPEYFGDECFDPAPVPTDISTYIGNTTPFTPDDAFFTCGTIENNQWFWFVPTCDLIHIGIQPGFCINGDGLQMALYEECSSNPIACEGGQQNCGFCPLNLVAYVVPGNTYLLMIDGFAGDRCDFKFTGLGCVSIIGDPDLQDTPHGCADAQYTVSLTEPVFGAAGYIWSATNGALVNGQTETVVYGPENISVTLTLGAEDGKVCVRAFNFTDTSSLICLPFTVDTNMYLVENGTICYDGDVFYSQYEAYGVPPLIAAGTYHFLLQNYYTTDGYLYPCEVHLEVNLTVEGSLSQLPAVVALGSQYTFPNGDVITNSGTYIWSDTLASGCRNDYLQKVFLIEVIQNGDGCQPDSVTFVMPGNGVLLECPGGFPAFLFSAGAQNVVYQNPGTFDLIAHLGGQEFLFEDTLTIQYAAAAQGAFSSTTDMNVTTFSNQSQNAVSYLWDFGDGNTSTEVNPVHTYSGPGTYTVTLTVFGPCGQATASQIVEITAAALQAALSASNNIGCQPLQVQFSDLSTGNPTSWSWQFPGGSPASSMEQNPSVIYLNPGTYDVTLTVSNQLGQSTTTQTALVSVAAVPSVGFSFSNTLDTAVFINQSLNAFSYIWDFGDPDSGAANSSTENDPTHIFSGPGTYLVVLQAINTCGTSFLQQWVTISGVAPVAAFLVDMTEGCAPLMVQFMDQSTGNPSSWSWSFPGAVPANSVLQNPLVMYSQPGIYPVSLTVENATGSSTATLPNFIFVDDVPSASFNTDINGGLVNFQPLDTNGETYSWNFGDPASGSDNTSEAPGTSHLYTVSGTYTATLIVGNACGFDTLSQTIVVQLSSSNAPEAFNMFRIMPNPSNGQFQLELQDSPSALLHCRLFNTLGQALAQRHLGAFNGYYSEKMDFRHLPPAVYLLELSTAEKRSWVRVVLE